MYKLKQKFFEFFMEKYDYCYTRRLKLLSLLAWHLREENTSIQAHRL